MWAEHYGYRIDLLDRTGRTVDMVYPDGRSCVAMARRRDLRWLSDIMSHTGMRDDFGRGLRETAERLDSWAQRFRERFPDAMMFRASGAMSGKTAFAASAPSQHPAMQAYAARKMREEQVEAEAHRRAWALGLDTATERKQAAADGETFVARVGRLWDEQHAATRLGLSVPDARRLRDAWVKAFPAMGDWLDVVARLVNDPAAQFRHMNDIALGSTAARRRALAPFQPTMPREWPAEHQPYSLNEPDLVLLRSGEPDAVVVNRRGSPSVMVLDFKTAGRFRGQPVETSLGHTCPPAPWCRGFSGVSVDVLQAMRS